MTREELVQQHLDEALRGKGAFWPVDPIVNPRNADDVEWDNEQAHEVFDAVMRAYQRRSHLGGPCFMIVDTEVRRLIREYAEARADGDI